MTDDVKDIDLGWKKISKNLKLINKSYTKVGIQGNAGSHEDGKEGGATIVMVGVYNEFGTQSIPARPFMRTSIEEKKNEIKKIQDSQYSKILQGKQTVKKALGVLGNYMVGQVQEKIKSIDTPPNAESTKARKGSSNPLIDTGRMRQSITNVVILQGKEKKAIK